MADLGSLLGAAGVGGAIGQAIVRLELDTSKYQAEMKSAQASTVASTNAMGTSTSKFAGLASTALLGVGVAAVAGAAMSVKAAIEANDAHLKLQNTFANNASLSDSSVEAFERQADALRDLTGVDDEAIITGQALLGQFDLTGQQVMELIPLIVDLSEKMDIDLQAATKAVGKASQGNAGILSRYGIVLDETALKADAYGTTLKGLGVVQGFAAESAKQEPWRVLGAQFEELAEEIGQALLPVLQSLSETLIDAMPTIERFIGLLEQIPKVSPGIVQAFAEIGERGNSALNEVLEAAVPLAEQTLAWGRDLYDSVSPQVEVFAASIINVGKRAAELAEEASDARFAVTRFAHMTGDALEEWSDDVKDAFDKSILAMSETEEQTIITRKEFLNSSRIMEREATQLNRALIEISKEKWINDNYIKFLSEQGPEWLVGFARLTEEQQHIAQDAWEESTRKTDKAKESLDRITGVLKTLDGGTSKHTVIIDYRYEGYDPSKPGMSAQQR